MSRENDEIPQKNSVGGKQNQGLPELLIITSLWLTSLWVSVLIAKIFSVSFHTNYLKMILLIYSHPHRIMAQQAVGWEQGSFQTEEEESSQRDLVRQMPGVGSLNSFKPLLSGRQNEAGKHLLFSVMSMLKFSIFQKIKKAEPSNKKLTCILISLHSLINY